jgi:hypothetical protein
MSESEEFQRNAEDCLRMADKSADEGDQRAWLRMAESWLRLIRPGAPGAGKPTPADEFEVLASTRGTGQKPSRESH